MEDEFDLETDDKIQLKKEMDESTGDLEKSTNPIVKKLNLFFKHPFGVLLSILLYAGVKRQISKINISSDTHSLEENFKLEFKQKMMSEMLESHE
jgi:hypothetical protein